MPTRTDPAYAATVAWASGPPPSTSVTTPPIHGALVTVNVAPLLGTPLTVTTTGPVAAPAGALAVTLVALQAVVDAAMPLNVTVLLPRVEPKFAPVIETSTPTGPDAGARLLMDGGFAGIGTTIRES